MKILQVIPYFVPAYGYGGPVKVCFDISKEMVRRGHQVTVATTDTLDGKNRIAKPEEEIDGIRILRFKNVSNRLAKNCNGYLPVGFYFWAKKNIKKFNAVHCHDFFTLQNIITAHFCKKYSVPFIIQPHGTLSPIRQKAKFSQLKKIFLKMFSSILESAKHIVALTENEKKELLAINKALESKIRVIPNGLDLKEFENVNKIDLHEKYNIPRENKIIGFIGRIQYIKGIDISLEIIALLKNSAKFTYLIAGPDEGEKKKLENKIQKLGLENNVIFTGILKGREKLETMKSWDLFLFTSRNEGLPMTILEIAALGVPQVISKNCHVPEVEKYGAGFEFELEEKNRIAEKIKSVLLNQQETESLKINAIEMTEKYFAISQLVVKLEKILT